MPKSATFKIAKRKKNNFQLISSVIRPKHRLENAIKLLISNRLWQLKKMQNKLENCFEKKNR